MNATMLDEGLVTVKEAARILGLSRSKVYGLLQQQELPFCKFGKSCRLPKKSLVCYLERNLVDPNSILTPQD
jgi:excisionase family DNA binding protein